MVVTYYINWMSHNILNFTVLKRGSLFWEVLEMNVSVFKLFPNDDSIYYAFSPFFARLTEVC